MKLEVGEMYKHDNKLWELVAMSSQKVTLKLVELFQQETKELDTVLCVKQLKHTKQAAAALLSVEVCSQRLCSQVCTAPIQQAEAWLLLLKTAETKHAKVWKYICLDGTHKAAYAACNIGPKQLLLLPETDAASKVTLKTPAGHKKHGLMQYAGQQYCILPPAFTKLGTRSLTQGSPALTGGVSQQRKTTWTFWRWLASRSMKSSTCLCPLKQKLQSLPSQ